MQIEELNQRIHKTSRLFEKLFEPINELLKEHTLMATNNHRKGLTFLKSISNDCSKTIQNFIMQLILFTIEYLFTQNDFKFSLKKDKSYIVLAVTQIEILKRHFGKLKNSQVDTIVQRIRKIFTDDEFSNEEGFFSSDDEKKEEDTNRSYFIQQSRYQGLVQENQAILREKEQQLQNLRQKLVERESQIADLTAGYLKDLQNMRDQMFRSNINEDEEFYEVKYFDNSDIDDPRYLQLLNAKISDLKSQYEKRTLELVTKNYHYKGVIKNLKNQLQILNGRVKNFENPEYLLNRALHLERNPYLIWKMIQDAKGNFFFEEVFDRQRNTYGINYAEVNHLIMKNKAYDRNYALYKSGIEDQLVNFIDSVQDQLKSLQDDNQALKKQNEELNAKMINSKRAFMNETTNEIFNKMNEWKNKQLFNIQQKFSSEFLKQKDFMIQKQRFALKTLGVAAQVSRLLRGKSDWVSVKQLISYAQEKNSFQELKFLREKNVELNEKILEEQKQNELNQIQISSEQWTQENINTEIAVLKESIRTLQEQLNYEVNQKKEVQLKMSIADKCCKSILKSIDQQSVQLVIQEMDENGEIRDKKFIDKLKTLSKNMIRLILEIQEQKQKTQIGLDALLNNTDKNEKSTLTDLCNLKVELGYQIHNNNFSSKNLQTSQIVVQTQNIQTSQVVTEQEQTIINANHLNSLQNTQQTIKSQIASSQPTPIQLSQSVVVVYPKIQKNVQTQTSQELIQKVIFQESKIQFREIPPLKQSIKNHNPKKNDSSINSQQYEYESQEKTDQSYSLMVPIQESKIEKEEEKSRRIISLQKTNGETKTSEDEGKLLPSTRKRASLRMISSESTPPEQIQHFSSKQVKTYNQQQKKQKERLLILKQKFKQKKTEKPQNQVFQRLFDDQFKRQERIDMLKIQLAKLEEQQFQDTFKLIDFQDETQNFLDQVMLSKQTYMEKFNSFEKIQEKQTKNQLKKRLKRNELNQTNQQSTWQDFSLTTPFNLFSPKGVIPMRSRAEFYFHKPKDLQELEESQKPQKKEKPKMRKTHNQAKSLLEKQQNEKLTEKFLITELATQIQSSPDQKTVQRNLQGGIQPLYSFQRKPNVSN